MDFITTGELAKRSQVNKETIRYYERKGLIPEPGRTESGYRMYSPEIVKRVIFIKNAQGLGFTLKEINELLGLKVTNINNCDDVHKMTDEKIKQIEEKVENLMKIKDSLVKLAESCERKESASDCLIIDTFDHGKC